MEFLLLNEVLKNWIFFQLPIQKSDFITLILSKFSILNANLWSIYSKKFEFMVYTFIYVFWKNIFFWLLRPFKQSGCLASLYKIASKGLNVEILQILFLKTTCSCVYFSKYVCCHAAKWFTGLFSKNYKFGTFFKYLIYFSS